MKKQLLDVLLKIGKRLNDIDAVWAVGASLMLHQYGLCESPNDIDIFVKAQDIDKVKQAMDLLGECKDQTKSSIYSSDYFFKYIIDGIDIDVISGYTIIFEGRKHKYNFDENAIEEFINFSGIEIPFCSLKDWAELYAIMPRGEKKAALIRDYFKKGN